jgi:DNA polymerase sigma
LFIVLVYHKTAIITYATLYSTQTDTGDYTYRTHCLNHNLALRISLWQGILKLILSRGHMINKRILEEVKEKLIKTYNPLEIYLFGSYAWGCPDEDSDLDLLIIIDHYT